MDSLYRFFALGTPWTQSMLSRDVNAATRLAEASWRRVKAHSMLSRDVNVATRLAEASWGRDNPSARLYKLPFISFMWQIGTWIKLSHQEVVQSL